jgi:hypothetical protein
MTVHTVRDWRGNKTQLSRCTVEELRGLLAQSIATANQIARFITEIETELSVRQHSSADARPTDARPTG